MQATIYLVDDELPILKSVRRVLQGLDAQIVIFESPIAALEACKNDKCPDLLISDQRMPLLLGTELIAQVKTLNKNTQCFLMSAYHDFDDVAKAFNLSNIDRYISKPWDNKELLLHVKEAIIVQNNDTNTTISNDQLSSLNIIAQSEVMLKVFSQAQKAATSNVPIFIHGETGTGKELIAKSCHHFSLRSTHDFVAFNCANFSDTLMESQLFGHKKGAFTGAVSDQQGIFSTAEKGTVFLDEVTCIPLPLQAKLLRVIQEREYSPVGSHHTHKFDVQILSASSTSLSQAVMDGTFREDLYYRLNVIHISIPPLRDRELDIILIAEYYLKRFSDQENKRFKHFDHQAKSLILNYNWPGNVRQLENLIHSLVILNDGEVMSYNLLKESLDNNPVFFQRDKVEKIEISSSDLQTLPIDINHNHLKPLWQMEQDYIEETINQCEGNVTKAASILEISPSTIYRKQQSWLKNQAQL
ncbi:MAG: sigma-54-dependent Fis family transcriptional regulator [Saccharospirillaceae bacterium]|nr:sigma-54 dependent transcriptional regulator [Pseudomonadales bacterium]NRB81215.1 sigma-54-dependent Fis family transcriptional regulator [Saccharospirillaceae bacterium]